MEVILSPAASVWPLNVLPAVFWRGFRRPCLQHSCPGAADAPVSTDRVFRDVLRASHAGRSPWRLWLIFSGILPRSKGACSRCKRGGAAAFRAVVLSQVQGGSPDALRSCCRKLKKVATRPRRRRRDGVRSIRLAGSLGHGRIADASRQPSAIHVGLAARKQPTNRRCAPPPGHWGTSRPSQPWWTVRLVYDGVARRLSVIVG